MVLGSIYLHEKYLREYADILFVDCL